MTGGQKARTDFVDAILLGTIFVVFVAPLFGFIAWIAWDWITDNPWIVAPALFIVLWLVGGFERQKMADEKDAYINGWDNNYLD